MKVTDWLRERLGGNVASDVLDSVITNLGDTQEFAVLTSKARSNISGKSFAYIDSKGEKHLPIHDAAHVRNALARFNQTHFESPSAKARALAKIKRAAARMGVKTSSEPCMAETSLAVFASETSETHSRLFNTLKETAEPPEWIPFLPKPGKYTHPSYGDILITPERNANFVSNFGKSVYQKLIPIDLEHQLSLSGAAGYIKGLRQNADGSVDANADWTDMGSEMFKRDRFKYFSPAWRDTWTDPLGNNHADVVIGGALTNRPFFKEPALRPLVTSEEGFFFTEEEVDGSTEEKIIFNPMPSDEDIESEETDDVVEIETIVDNLAAEPEFTFVGNTNPANRVWKLVQKKEATMPDGTENKLIQMTEDEYKKFQEMQVSFTAMSERNTQLETAVTTLTRSARHNRFSEIAASWIGDKDANIATLEALADSLGEENEVFTKHVESMRAAAEQTRQAVLMSEIGSNNGGYSVPADVNNTMEKMAAEFMASDPKLTKEQAFVEVMVRHPEVYAQYEADKKPGLRK